MGDIQALLSEYPSVIQVPVFWGDMDSMRHVNNVVYFRWFEEARIRLLESLDELQSLGDSGVGLILAHVECDFRRQSFFPDSMHIGSRIESVGRSSLHIRHSIVSETQRAVVAEGKATTVLFDYGADKPTPIGAPLRTALEALSARR
jgi:acyl-CoA thioester hydrolase